MTLSDPSPSAVNTRNLAASPEKRGNGNGWVICPCPDTPSVHLLSAIQFTYDELVGAYNQTRVDYIVPMPMNAARLREYLAEMGNSLVGINRWGSDVCDRLLEFSVGGKMIRGGLVVLGCLDPFPPVPQIPRIRSPDLAGAGQ